jgi:hypothetical protein
VFYKHAHLEKKLRENGRSAPAEILGIRTEGSGSGARAMRSTDDDLTTTWFLCWMHLRVIPDDGPPFEASVRTRLNTLKSKGDTVPVLYDPNDHDKLVVDYESDARAAMDRASPGAAGVDPELAELDALEKQVEAATPAAAPADASQARLDRLEQLADLHDRGVLTDAELAAEKAKILNEG